MLSRQPIICVVGPTASGKSTYAQELAIKIDAEIISADSMQIYKGMDIGTSKIPPEERKVKHWGIDIVEPWQTYSVSLYQKYARNCVEEIRARKKNVVLCGGTGFYIRSVIDDYRFIESEQENNPIREYYNKIAVEQGSKAIWEILKEKDSASADIIHPNNTVRIVRALEMIESGNSYAEKAQYLSKIKEYYTSKQIGMHVNREILYQNINNRVDQMIKKGLLDEVKKLHDAGLAEALTAKAAIGYKELIEYFNKKISLNDAIEKIKRNTRRYAKRQMTWFNRDKRIEWVSNANS